MTNTKTIKYSVVLAAIVLVGVLFFVSSQDNTKGSSADVPGSSVSSGLAPNALASRDNGATIWQDAAGEYRPPRLQGRYALDYVMTLTDRSSGNTVNFKLGGELVLVDDVAVDENEPRERLLAELREPRVSLTGPGSESLTDLPSGNPGLAFKTPFQAEYDDDGNLVKTRFSKEMPQSARATLDGIFAATQLIAPSDTATEEQWKLQENSFNGAYEATYKRSGEDLLEKRWSIGKNKQGPTTLVLEASSDFALAAPNRIDTVDHKMDMYVDVTTSGRNVYHTKFTISLVRLGDPHSLAFMDAARAASTPYQPDRHIKKETPEDYARSLVRGRSYREVYETAVTASVEGNWQQRVTARNNLSAALKLEPEYARVVADQLREGIEEPDLERTLIEALAGSNTPQAHREVASIMSDQDMKRALREDMVQVSMFMSEPSAELLTALTALTSSNQESDRMNQGATVALGSAIGNMRENEHPEYQDHLDKFIDYASERLSTEELANEMGGMEHSVNVERDLVRLFDALGNTGAEEALALIEKGTNAKSEWVRGAAYYALRDLKSDEATRLINKAILEDESREVRVDALEACQFMGPERTLSAVKTALFQDRSTMVKLAAARNISIWSYHDKGMLELFERALESETDPTVRQTLENYLNPVKEGAVPARTDFDTGFD